MAGLQRSAVSFRRQGSSGLVWDDRFLSGELAQVNQKEQEQEQQEKIDTKHEKDAKASRSVNTIERNRSNGGQRGYRTGRVSPAIEPPSPKVSACGFCSAFGKHGNNHGKRTSKGRSQ